MFRYRSFLIVALATFFLISLTCGEELCIPDNCQSGGCGQSPVTKSSCPINIGQFISKEAVCDCCDHCITFLERGAKCVRITETIVNSNGKRFTYDKKCGPGLSCKVVCK